MTGGMKFDIYLIIGIIVFVCEWRERPQSEGSPSFGELSKRYLSGRRLMLAGDIETNPGPNGNQGNRYNSPVHTYSTGHRKRPNLLGCLVGI